MNESFPQAAQNPDLQKKYCSDSALGSNLWMNSLIIQEYSFQADSHENSEDLVKKKSSNHNRRLPSRLSHKGQAIREMGWSELSRGLPASSLFIDRMLKDSWKAIHPQHT